MAIGNPFDLLGDDSNDEPTRLFELAQKKASEDAKALAAANAVARFVALRAAAEREDKEREEAKVRAEKEKWKAKKKKEREEQLKLNIELSDKGSETGEDKISRKVKERRSSPRVYPGDCEKPRLPPVPPVHRRKQIHRSSSYGYGSVGGSSERHSSEQSDSQSGYGDEHIEGNYEQPLVSVDGPSTCEYKNAKPEGDALSPGEMVEKAAFVTSDAKGDSEPENNVSHRNAQTEDNSWMSGEQVGKAASVSSDANKDNEPEKQVMTYNEYVKMLEEKKKASLALKTAEQRKVQIDKDLEKMKQLSLKKQNDENVKVARGSEKYCGKGNGISNQQEDREGMVNYEAQSIRLSIFRAPKYFKPRPSTTLNSVASDGDHGKARDGAQPSTGTVSLVASSDGSKARDHGNHPRPYTGQKDSSSTAGVQGRSLDNSQAYRLAYRGQPRASAVPYGEHQGRGRGYHPQSRAPRLQNPNEFPPLKW